MEVREERLYRVEDGIVHGKTNREIGMEIGLATRTIKQLSHLVYRRNGLKTNASPMTNRVKLVAMKTSASRPKQKVKIDLKRRERQVLQEIEKGNDVFAMMEVTGLTYATVKNVLREVMEKTGMGTRIELLIWARAHKY